MNTSLFDPGSSKRYFSVFTSKRFHKDWLTDDLRCCTSDERRSIYSCIIRITYFKYVIQSLPNGLPCWKWYQAFQIEVGKEFSETKLRPVKDWANEITSKTNFKKLTSLESVWGRRPVPKISFKSWTTLVSPDLTKSTSLGNSLHLKQFKFVSIRINFSLIASTISSSFRMVSQGLEWIKFSNSWRYCGLQMKSGDAARVTWVSTTAFDFMESTSSRSNWIWCAVQLVN